MTFTTKSIQGTQTEMRRAFGQEDPGTVPWTLTLYDKITGALILAGLIPKEPVTNSDEPMSWCILAVRGSDASITARCVHNVFREKNGLSWRS